eukprot:TRINITY_DN6946_c0_g1_i1.p1 TRINITY_DN6946_c0_g1~~TRINITY_DN6946_c0_g1_i1.p1  ORF type:complete len:136 (+),score=16.90 TRINITY_DN6946_c0_g1_i1:130-537(+)
MGFEHVVLKGVQGRIADAFLARKDTDMISCRLRSLRCSLDSPFGVCDLGSIGGRFLSGCTSLEAVDLTIQVIDLKPLSNITSIGKNLLFGAPPLRWSISHRYPTSPAPARTSWLASPSLRRSISQQSPASMTAPS